MNILNYIPEYEEYYGQKMSPEVVRFVEQLDIVGKKFEQKGCNDAANGLPAACDESFEAWGKKVFDFNPELAESMGDIMKLCYMDGYREGGTA